MTQTELHFYPKLSPIYNKILQLLMAIALIMVVMNLWVYSSSTNYQGIDEHFNAIGQQYLQQTSTGIEVLLAENNKKAIQDYIDGIAKTSWITGIHLYDTSGQVIASSENSQSIIELYGLSLQKLDRSIINIPFVQELRTSSLNGYVRITIEKNYLVNDLQKNSHDQFGLLRLMLILSGVVGFLLTRGLNRFSRQGFRMADHKLTTSVK